MLKIFFILLFLFFLYLEDTQAAELQILYLNKERDSLEISDIYIDEIRRFLNRTYGKSNIQFLPYSYDNPEDFISYFNSSLVDSEYDLFIANDEALLNFRDHFVNLYEYISKEHIEKYPKKILPIYKKKLYGLPLYLKIFVLYYNKELLNKYKVKIPTTWDELLENAQYIIEEGKKDNNYRYLKGYNGLFPYSESGTNSLYEFIYSFRGNNSSEFPDLNSENAIEALNKIKKLKDNISSDFEFQIDSIHNYYDNKYIFTRSRYDGNLWTNDTSYTVVPGNISETSCSVSNNLNIGINKHISKEKIKIAAEVIKYLTSEEFQKKMMLGYNEEGFDEFRIKHLSGIFNLYDDDEVCKEIDCNLMKNICLFMIPTTKEGKYYEWSEFFRNKLYEFIYGNRTADEVLKEVAEEKSYQFNSGMKSMKFNKEFIILFICLFIYLIY